MSIQSVTEQSSYQSLETHERFKKALAIIGDDLKSGMATSAETIEIEKRIKKLNHEIRSDNGKLSFEGIASKKNNPISFRHKPRH